MENKVTAILALAAGMAIGLTWPRTKKYVRPILKGAQNGVGAAYWRIMGFCATQKERVEDLVAGAKAKKKSPRRTKKKKAATQARRTQRKVKETSQAAPQT